MTRFSAFSLFANALSSHKKWPQHWPDAAPKASYDAIIVGAGGHGLGAAYYLASRYGITNVAVIEKGWLGGGNTGRNTTIIRSNYLYDESAHLYDHAVKLWDGLSQDINFNVMYSKRGVMMLAHNVHDVQSFKRHIHANRLNGVDNEWLTPEEAKAYCPPLSIDPGARYPVLGAALQRRGGTARHDSVAWGYARAAARLGVDIIQNCAVTGIGAARTARLRVWKPNAALSLRRRLACRRRAIRRSSCRWRGWIFRSKAIRCRRLSPNPSNPFSPALSCRTRCMPI
jgi:sarcosine oxidase subunit beta